MALIVQKFGGTSVNGEVRLKACVALVKKELNLGNQVIVVVSAMAGVTNSLLAQAFSMGKAAGDAKREIDSIISAGEQISSGMMAIALNEIGIKSRSWLGWQLPIYTDDKFTDAAIDYIEVQSMMDSLNMGVTPVIAGFQGVNNGGITTLGRGGADTTAAAIAAAVKADRCDIYTDVDGVYTADPHAVPNVRKLESISYEELLEMTSWGAKVVHNRCVEIAMRNKLLVQVLSSFNDVPGTLITDDGQKRGVTGITSSIQPLVIIRLVDCDNPEMFSKLKIIGRDGVNILLPAAEQEEYEALLYENKVNYDVKDNLRSISLVGSGIVKSKVLDTMRNHDINVEMSLYNDLRMTMVVDASVITDAIIQLHRWFCLDK